MRSVGGRIGTQADDELVRQEAEGKQERLQAGAAARKRARGTRAGRRRIAWESYRVDSALDLFVNLADLACVLGGGLAAVVTLGYALAGRGVSEWGLSALILLLLLAANVSLRILRAHRRVNSRRYPEHRARPRMRERSARDTGSMQADTENDFDWARRRHTLAALSVLPRRRRAAAEPLSFDEVVARLRRRGERSLGLQSIPLDSIVGTVDKRRDFDRGFRPISNRVRERWVQIALAQRRGASMPPIEVFRVGDQHFVRDGHHRVSIATATGNEMIDAIVTEVLTAGR